jgi:uncharacterized membrane protein
MKSWSRAIATFVVGYLIATAVGWSTFTQPTVMWVLTFTLMPLVFAGLAYTYFRGTKPNHGEARREAIRLILFWIILSFVLDGLVFIGVIPLAFGAKPNWTFFVNQSPWIWLCYAALVPIIFGGLYAYERHPQLATAGEA